MSEAIDYLAALEREGGSLGNLARGNLDAPIPACPDYDMAGLVAHVGWVYSFVCAQLGADDPMSPAAPGDSGTPGDGDLLDWYEERRAELISALRSTGTEVPMWTFGVDKTSGFYHRRMAHESAVHRWDADQAVNGTGAAPIDRTLALDGIDELFDVAMPRALDRDGDLLPGGSLHLHATDGDGEWLFTVNDGEIDMTNEHAKGDAAVRGPVSDLLLFMWNRGRGSCEVFGDESVAESWAALAP